MKTPTVRAGRTPKPMKVRPDCSVPAMGRCLRLRGLDDHLSKSPGHPQLSRTERDAPQQKLKKFDGARYPMAKGDRCEGVGGTHWNPTIGALAALAIARLSSGIQSR
jgi:hypothetical protein